MNRNQNQRASQSQAGEDYFDLHVKGCGYLSRVRDVPVGRRGSETFLACSVSAMHGLCTDPSYSYFDLKVTGAEAVDLIRQYEADVLEGRKVFVAFRAGDIYADPYEVDERDPKTRRPTGKRVMRASIKGRLLQITHMKVDGMVVFSADDDRSGGDDTPAPQHHDEEPGDNRDATPSEPRAERGSRTARSEAQGRQPAHREPGRGIGQRERGRGQSVTA